MNTMHPGNPADTPARPADGSSGGPATRRSISDEAATSASAIRQDAEDLIDRAAEEAAKLRSAASDYGESVIRQQKLGAADAVSNIAASLRDAGDRLADSPNLRELVEDVAHSLDDVVRNIRSRSLSELVADAEEFARQRPLTVAAGAAICGLFVARFVKSSGAESAPRDTASAAGSDYDYRREW